MAAFGNFSTTFCATSNASLAEMVTPLFWSSTIATFSVQCAFANIHIGQALSSKDRVKLDETVLSFWINDGMRVQGALNYF